MTQRESMSKLKAIKDSSIDKDFPSLQKLPGNDQRNHAKTRSRKSVVTASPDPLETEFLDPAIQDSSQDESKSDVFQHRYAPKRNPAPGVHGFVSKNKTQCPHVLILGISAAGKSTLLTSMKFSSAVLHCDVTYEEIIYTNLIGNALCHIKESLVTPRNAIESEDNERQIQKLKALFFDGVSSNRDVCLAVQDLHGGLQRIHVFEGEIDANQRLVGAGKLLMLRKYSLFEFLF